MKTTGMVRRIDELGRIVIPKEIRKQLMMKEGESIAFSLEDDKVVLTKFSSLNKLSSTVQILLEGLYNKYHNTFLLCDQDKVIAVSSDGLAQYQRKFISKDLSLVIQNQEQKIETPITLLDENCQLTVLPLQYEQAPQGALLMITKQTPYYMMEEGILKFVKDIIEQEIDACV